MATVSGANSSGESSLVDEYNSDGCRRCEERQDDGGDDAPERMSNDDVVWGRSSMGALENRSQSSSTSAATAYTSLRLAQPCPSKSGATTK